jgi:adenine-specific DNA-methyltransferase
MSLSEKRAAQKTAIAPAAAITPTIAVSPAPTCAQSASSAAPLDVARLGQVFTPETIVSRLLSLRKNTGRTLDPSCGDGAFSRQIPGCVAIELDARHAPAGALVQDFFTYSLDEQFDTIIGNPPYVKARDIAPETRRYLSNGMLDGHANLYVHFIEKCVRHLKPGGELIFITPRDFLKATGAARLNTWLADHGSFTHFDDLGDAKIFKGATPNCAIWRFEKGRMNHRLDDGRRMNITAGHLSFTRGIYTLPFDRVFAVKVGAVSGADDIFTDFELGNRDFVCSQTAQTGELRRMICFDDTAPRGDALAHLLAHKERLLARRVNTFTEANWWKWGRKHHSSTQPRIYVNLKTRAANPFFRHSGIDYDGSILALFPHRRDLTERQLTTLTRWLNEIDWHELGFVCDGRYLFSQRSLQHALLPDSFAEFVAR